MSTRLLIGILVCVIVAALVTWHVAHRQNSAGPSVFSPPDIFDGKPIFEGERK